MEERHLKKKSFILVVIRFLHNASQETKPLLCIFCYILFFVPDHYLHFKESFQGHMELNWSDTCEVCFYGSVCVYVRV